MCGGEGKTAKCICYLTKVYSQKPSREEQRDLVSDTRLSVGKQNKQLKTVSLEFDVFHYALRFNLARVKKKPAVWEYMAVSLGFVDTSSLIINLNDFQLLAYWRKMPINSLSFLFFQIYLFSVYKCFACMHVCITHVYQVLMKDRRNF